MTGARATGGVIDAQGRVVGGFYGPGEAEDWDELASQL